MIEMKKFDNIMDVYFKAIEECEEYYSKHRHIIEYLASEYFKHQSFYYRDLERYKKFYKYLYEFSDYIAKRYFPNEIDEFWRRPCALEDGVNMLMMKNLMHSLKTDPKFKEEIISDLQTDPKIKDDPLAPLIESMIAGVSIEASEFAIAVDIPKRETYKKINKMIKTKQLKIDKDIYFI